MGANEYKIWGVIAYACAEQMDTCQPQALSWTQNVSAPHFNAQIVFVLWTDVRSYSAGDSNVRRTRGGGKYDEGILELLYIYHESCTYAHIHGRKKYSEVTLEAFQ